MQLDLFEHSRDVVLRNALVQALLRTDTSAAVSARSALAAEYPDDRVLDDASTLIDLLPQIGVGWGNAAVRKAHAQIEQQISPAATRLFGDKPARAWLRALWARLARSASKLPYSRDDPQWHAAALWLRAGEWEAVVEAVESIESWRRIPAPLSWMARARWQLSGLDLALPLLAELAWISPACFDELARSLEDRALRALLQRFDADFEGEGDREDAAWFPAWVLTDQPRVSELLAGCQTSRGTEAELGWELMRAVLNLEHQGRHADLIEHRKRLKGLHEGLYRSYMKSR